MTTLGVHLGVELPQATGLPTGETSVNLSGPTRAVHEREGWSPVKAACCPCSDSFHEEER